MPNRYSSKIIRSAAVLTTSYVAADVLGQTDNNAAQELNQIVLYVDITLGSLTSVELKIEKSDDGINYYQESFVSISGGTGTVSLGEYTFTANGSYEIDSPFKSKFVKVSVKGTGTVTSSSCTIRGVLGIS